VTEPAHVVEIAGRTLRPTIVADTYWRLAAERQRVYQARLDGDRPPWTGDEILSSHRFTNCYRAADRVSQALITQASYRGSQDPAEVLFRTLLFRIFNRPQTWNSLVTQIGEITWTEYSFRRYTAALAAKAAEGGPLYSAAYIMPRPRSPSGTSTSATCGSSS
jgi:hypothetical protein